MEVSCDTQGFGGGIEAQRQSGPVEATASPFAQALRTSSLCARSQDCSQLGPVLVPCGASEAVDGTAAPGSCLSSVLECMVFAFYL